MSAVQEVSKKTYITLGDTQEGDVHLVGLSVRKSDNSSSFRLRSIFNHGPIEDLEEESEDDSDEDSDEESDSSEDRTQYFVRRRR